MSLNSPPPPPPPPRLSSAGGRWKGRKREPSSSPLRITLEIALEHGRLPDFGFRRHRHGRFAPWTPPAIDSTRGLAVFTLGMALDSRASSRSAGQTERKAPTSTKEDKQRLTKRRQRRETKRNETARRYSFVLCVCVCVSFQGKRLSRAVFEFKVARFRMAEASLVAAITAAVFFFFFFCCSTSSFSFFSFSSRSRPFLSYKFSRFSKAPPSSFFFLKETPGRSFCCLFCSFFFALSFPLSLSLSLHLVQGLFPFSTRL